MSYKTPENALKSNQIYSVALAPPRYIFSSNNMNFIPFVLLQTVL